MRDALIPIYKVVYKSLLRFSGALLNYENFRGFIISTGWIPEINETQYQSFLNSFQLLNKIQTFVSKIRSIVSAPNYQQLIELESALTLIKEIYSDIESLAALAGAQPFFPLNQAQFWNEISGNLFDRLLYDYIKNESPVLYVTLQFIGVLSQEKIYPTQANRVPYYEKKIIWDKLFEFLTHPTQRIKDEFNWSTGNVNYEKVGNFLRALSIFNIDVDQTLLSESNYTDFYNGYPLGNSVIEQSKITFFRELNFEANEKKELSISIFPNINSSNSIDGLCIVPKVEGVASVSFSLTPKSMITGEGYFSLDNALGFSVYPAEKSKIIMNDANIAIGAKLAYIYYSKLGDILFGNERGSRLLFYGTEVSVEIRGSIQDPEIILRLGTGNVIKKPNFLFIYNPVGNDNFIKQILGKKPLSVPFGLGISWSSKHGIGFEGNVGFTKEIPLQNKQKGEHGNFLRIPSLKIEAKGGNEGAYLSLGADVELDVNVIQLSVRNIGVKISLDKKSSGNKGLLNNLDFDFDFKFPDGVALAINAGPVKGAGFLDYNAATSTYTGGLELTFSKISFSAIGIISTKLPGGKEGYSLLIIITAEFSAIQLGMGFTLNGLGGLLGLNRTMNPDVLRAGLRDKTLDSILFPKDIINNKDTIISNIGQAFPVMEGQFMVGPMAKIGWGTPTLITIELGIILEFPEPVRLAILGVLRAILPSEDKAVLKLQINFLGIIDFTAKYLSFDASIYDSKILTFPLMGDMALRLYWGDKPNFLMSVGGFHPRYTPPPLNLPKLRRLSLMLADEKNFKIGVEAYFAVSSNSVQFGAKVAAEARMWDGKINVLGALWFDILFKFNPFYFAADMGAQFAVRWKSKEILSIFINLMLEGPNPWRAQGKGTFKVIGIGVTVSFDKTFGKVVAETIAPVSLDDKFAEQLAHKDNWEALLPQRSHQQILWKEAAADEGLIVDTGGQLRFSQKLLPLNIDLNKFGTAPISDTKRFEITGYALTQSGQTESFTTLSPAKDLFARSEYFNMTDDDKLSKDPYESFESGVFIGSDKFSSDYAVHRKVVYEDIVIDTGFRDEKLIKWPLSSELMQVHLLDSYVSKSALSDFTTVGSNAAPPKVAAVNVTEERFVVVDRDSLAIISATYSSSAAAEHFLATQMQSSNTAGNWIVANEFELV